MLKYTKNRTKNKMNSLDFKIITNSLINSLFCKDYDFLSEDELKHICSVIDYPTLEIRYISDNPDVYPYVQWDKLDKMQAIRLVVRNQKLLEKINLKKFDYKPKEILYLIKNNYKLIFQYFNFDYANMPQEDAFVLFCLGKDEFLELMDITKYKFGFIEMFDIIRSYKYRKYVVEKLNYKELKNYQITEILINTGDECVDLFNLDLLNTLNWIELLGYQPEFLYNCDIDKFIEGDPFNLVQLVTMFNTPDISYLLDKIDTGIITPFGWEKLLIYNYEKFAKLCDFSKLNENNWLEIISAKPDLAVYKNQIDSN